MRGIHELDRAGRRAVGLFYALEGDDEDTALLAALARVAPGVPRAFERRYGDIVIVDIIVLLDRAAAEHQVIPGRDLEALFADGELDGVRPVALW